MRSLMTMERGTGRQQRGLAEGEKCVEMMMRGWVVSRTWVRFPPPRGFFISCKRGIERGLKVPGHERTMKI